MKITMKAMGVALLLLLIFGRQGEAAPNETSITPKSKCPVCGMFVYKYKPWWAQIRYSDGDDLTFDGVKDMMVHYLAQKGTEQNKRPERKVTEVWVKDYYSLQWIKAEESSFVIGSDVFGPMGHEFIPFSSRAAAENFMGDHKGKAILRFHEISAEQVEMMRRGSKMKHTLGVK